MRKGKLQGRPTNGDSWKYPAFMLGQDGVQRIEPGPHRARVKGKEGKDVHWTMDYQLKDMKQRS